METDRGFTFIEVLVVLLVLGIGVLGVLQATLLAERLEFRSAALTTGTFLAQERLERISALGWERAMAGLTEAALPASLGQEGLRPQEEVLRPEARYLLVFERESGAVDPPLCTVHCYWSRGPGEFDPRNALRLAVRRRR